MTGMEITPDLLTADYEGEPGKRTFFLQSRTEEGVVSFLIEKQQVALLADRMRELLLLIDEADPVRDTPAERDPSLSMAIPAEAEWRVGTMGLAYDEATDSISLMLRRIEESPEAELERDEEDFDVRFVLRRDQVRALALHASAVVDEGRPMCQLCGLPMDPSGHQCPASNGHRLSG